MDETKNTYESIEGYHNILKGQEKQPSNGSVENKSVKSSGAIDNIWIESFIRSPNWVPKKRGFTINGKAGYAEFSDVFLSGTFSNSLLTIEGNDINLYDDSTGSGGTVTGNTSTINFIRTDTSSQYFTIRKRAGKNNDLDNVLELFSSANEVDGISGSPYQISHGYNVLSFGGGASGSAVEAKIGLVSLTSNIHTAYAYNALNGAIQISVCTDGVSPTYPHISIFDSRAFNSGYSGVSALLDGSGTNSIVGIAHAGNGYMYYDKSGIAGTANVMNSGCHLYPDVNSSFNLGSSSKQWSDIYYVTGHASSDIRIKTEVRPVIYGLDTVYKIEPIQYKMHGKEHIGFSAQAISKLIPEITENCEETSEIGTATITTTELIPILVKAIQELKDRLEKLENK